MENLSVIFENINSVELAQRTGKTPENIWYNISKNPTTTTLISLVKMAQAGGMKVSVELKRKDGAV